MNSENERSGWRAKTRVIIRCHPEWSMPIREQRIGVRSRRTPCV